MNKTCKIAELPSHIATHYDLFVGSVSYEDRCLEIYDNLKNEVSFEKVLWLYSKEHKPYFYDRLNSLVCANATQIELVAESQMSAAAAIAGQLALTLAKKQDASFLVDVTTFMRQNLLIFLRVIRNMLSKSNLIDLLYSPAEEYGVGMTLQDKWLSRGVLRVESVLGYAGIIRPSQPYHLIVLMGYEVDRAAALIAAYEPSKVTIGYSCRAESINDDQFDLNLERFRALASEFPSARQFEFSCVDIGKTKAAILCEVDRYTNHNVVVAPLNNKVSTVACALVAFERKEVQITTAVAALYNVDSYSSVGDSAQILEVEGLLKSRE